MKDKYLVFVEGADSTLNSRPRMTPLTQYDAEILVEELTNANPGKPVHVFQMTETYVRESTIRRVA